MERVDRIAMYEGVLDLFLSRAKEKGCVTFATSDDSDQYVQFQLRSGTVYGEVGSRQWIEPERPLTPAAVTALAQMGFVDGGPERNYAKHGLPRSKAELALLTDALFRAAYDVDDGFLPVLHGMNLNDVTFPRAEPFTREMIETHLKARLVQYLRDEDGDFRVDLRVEEIDNVAITWFIAEGAGDTMYRISSSTPWHPSWTREQALERCNQWNREHRWPKAMVLDAEPGWRLATSADIDLSAGVTRSFFAGFTDDVVHGTLEFWMWLGSADGVAPGTPPADTEERQ